jgi:hypothetical protein
LGTGKYFITFVFLFLSLSPVFLLLFTRWIRVRFFVTHDNVCVRTCVFSVLVTHFSFLSSLCTDGNPFTGDVKISVSARGDVDAAGDIDETNGGNDHGKDDSGGGGGGGSGGGGVGGNNKGGWVVAPRVTRARAIGFVDADVDAAAAAADAPMRPGVFWASYSPRTITTTTTTSVMNNTIKGNASNGNVDAADNVAVIETTETVIPPQVG